MKLIHPTNKNYKLYPHIFINNETWGYTLETFPPKEIPLLKEWQIPILYKSLAEDAKNKNLLLRH